MTSRPPLRPMGVGSTSTDRTAPTAVRVDGQLMCPDHSCRARNAGGNLLECARNGHPLYMPAEPGESP